MGHEARIHADGTKAQGPAHTRPRGIFMQPHTLAVHVDLARLVRVLALLSVLSFGVAALGVVGEVLGWWNELGEALAAAGTAGGVLLGVIAFFVNTTKGQVSLVVVGVAEANRKLDQANERLGGIADLLRDIRDRL